MESRTWDTETRRKFFALGLQICGNQAALRKSAAIIKRLYLKFGDRDTEAMMRGALVLGWTDLRSLNSKDGLGRRWALEAFWRSENKRRPSGMQELGSVLKEAQRRAP